MGTIRTRIKISYVRLTDADLDTTANAGIFATTGNPAFTFTKNELSDATTALTNYHNALGGVATGNNTAITKKENTRDVLLDKLRILCSSINLQANGDLTKLQSTGFPINKIASHQVMSIPSNFKVDHGKNAGEIILSVTKPRYNNRGCVFAFWNPIYGDAPNSIDDWFHRFCNGHKLTLKKLKPGTKYPFSVAYKGTDTDPLIWSDVVMKTASD
jgi:hypothetical protein